MAEITGFEPVKGCYALNDLANRRFQPLSHISISTLIFRICFENFKTTQALF